MCTCWCSTSCSTDRWRTPRQSSDNTMKVHGWVLYAKLDIFALIFWGILLYGHFWGSSSVMLDFGWQLAFHFSTIHCGVTSWECLIEHTYRCSPDSPCGGSRGTSAGAPPSSTPASKYSPTYPADLAEHTLYTHVHVGREFFLCRGNKLKTIDYRPFGCQ